MACVAVNSLVRTIELELLQPLPRPIVRQKQLIPANKNLIQNLHQKLGDLIELFDENRMDGIQAIKDLETKLRDVAFRVEDEIEFQIVHLYEIEEMEELLAGIAGLFLENPQRTIDAEEDLGIAADLFVEKPQSGETDDAQRSWHSFKLGCILEEAIRDIDAIYKDLSKVKMEYVALQGIRRKTTTTTLAAAAASTTSSGGENASHSQPLQGSNIMVGKDNEFQIVMGMLIQHSSKQREIVSIKGMGGIGKTTLAKRVYEDSSTVFHFDKRAWVVASQYHDKSEMLTDLLESMGDSIDGSTKEDWLAQRLYQKLVQRRYFVVIDDIWSVEAWDSVKACFPDNGNGSRVLLTTRFAEVATIIGSNNDFSHQMQLLEEDESWNLFNEKRSNSLRSEEFDMIVRPIVKKCRGLPLAIVVAAGLFSKIHTLDEWKNVAEALNSSATTTTTTTIEEECSRILSSSYNHLPHSSKACFLYLSIFPEDKEIRIKNVVKLWIAEGLVKASKGMSFDPAARRHIQELKDRNLILVSRPSGCGRKVKTFRMHDLLHSLCVREAKKENLLHVVYKSRFNFPQKDFRWVSIQSQRLNEEKLYSSLINCRSIFVFSGQYTFSNSKLSPLSRVLYNTGVCEIAYLVHLRCVLSCLEVTISDPFCNWNLQTLSGRRIDKMSFLEFPQLQHLRSDWGLSDFPISFPENLKSICGLIPDQCTKEVFTKIPYLKKVMILCEDGWSDCINNIAYSHQLQSLHLLGTYLGPPLVIPNINDLVCLKNLMKLRFSYLRFEWKAINILSKLPKLEVLRLSRCMCIGEEWELSEEENFNELIYLEIKARNLERWEASDCNFPNLERLVLDCCKELENIPDEFAEIPNLKSIELYGCLHSAVDSAKEIQRKQLDQGNDNMVVIVENIKELKSSSGSSEDDELSS
ncbi:PREDICTED: putative late blight resistance protein homolog R1B-17 isoform X2 [Ipomoea nil]|uniref:putative late blight resistance protein homolog R1B-17 isoform X2 n=1 Tax=Ipomoea nil TaxID=35883 RepID=UPI0009013F62|nr:PREDICTED: putative late blight resistance protein homolog R1B-17 isoform X2 [Ipomoea nil]XP_019181334.1 PREDICTED: putative late blight resistance protein homolog R1B-17 isoform X2 [Ipomoea nil]